MYNPHLLVCLQPYVTAYVTCFEDEMCRRYLLILPVSVRKYISFGLVCYTETSEVKSNTIKCVKYNLLTLR